MSATHSLQNEVDSMASDGHKRDIKAGTLRATKHGANMYKNRKEGPISQVMLKRANSTRLAVYIQDGWGVICQSEIVEM